MRGYSYDRRDVTGRGLANAYAQTLGTIFSSGGEKPYEVEIFVAEVADTAEDDQIYRLTYDGSVADEHGFAVMGGSAEQVSNYLEANYQPGLDIGGAIRLAVDALGHDTDQPRTVTADKLEVAALDRTRSQPRKFRRMTAERLAQHLPTPHPEPVMQAESAPVHEEPAQAALPEEVVDPGDAVGDLPPDSPPSHE
jgi:proteasome alpha subunit